MRDRRSAGDDDRLAARHRLEQGRRRAGVRVLANRKRHHSRPDEAFADACNRDVDLQTNVRGTRLEPLGVVGRRHDAKRPVGKASRQIEEKPKSRRGSAPIDTTSSPTTASASGRKLSVSTPNATNSTRGPWGLARPVVPRPPPSRTRRSCRGAGTHRRTLDSRSAPSAVRGARGDQSPRRRPVVSRGPACRGAQAECLPYRRSRTRHRSDSAR